MEESAHRYNEVDRNLAANLIIFREAAGFSQEELAQRMSERGFGFSQATIWKIERNKRPVRVSELLALADALDRRPLEFTRTPEETRLAVQLRQAHGNAFDAHESLKEAASEYLRAQVDVLVAAHSAHEAGLSVSELDTAYLAIPPEHVVIEARVEYEMADAQQDQLADAAQKVIDALSAAGYHPTLRLEDVTTIPGGPPALWNPTDHPH
ncbi:helix-turn-helix transcriptional regulator [Nonomuraea sp. NPDC048901]|uniref:helix-turn-helix domain-containing protein n=1 Tax=Nonomuraea sp. NPDC048901 TaxID=3155627 RepID=UPI0033DB1C0B